VGSSTAASRRKCWNPYECGGETAAPTFNDSAQLRKVKFEPAVRRRGERTVQSELRQLIKVVDGIESGAVNVECVGREIRNTFFNPEAKSLNVSCGSHFRDPA